MLTWSGHAVTSCAGHQITAVDAFSWLSLLIAHQPIVSECMIIAKLMAQ